MRPDRIVVGEVRGAEALDMLTALTTGHDGSLSTIHAGDAAEALRRLETLALMAGLGLPHAAIREQVADAIDLVVVQARGSDGTRRVIGVSEVVRVAGGAGVRELYALRSGRPCWRAPLGDSLAGRLAAAGPTAGSSRDGDPKPGSSGDGAPTPGSSGGGGRPSAAAEGAG
jgi:pilus assembly protein CpaF